MMNLHVITRQQFSTMEAELGRSVQYSQLFRFGGKVRLWAILQNNHYWVIDRDFIKAFSSGDSAYQEVAAKLNILEKGIQAQRSTDEV